MNKAVLIKILLFTLLLTGCKTFSPPITHKPSQTYEWSDQDFINSIKKSSEVGDWKQAYSIVENRYLLGKGLEPVIDIISVTPDILNKGAVDLIRSECLHQSEFIKKKRLDGYTYLKANGVNIDQPTKAIATCTQNPVELKISGNATLDEIEYADEYGTVLSVQIMNESSRGTSLGSNMGSTLAQASYIDNSSLSNYKATNQVVLGVVGAVIGNMLDKKSVTQFRKIYYVRIGNELAKIEKVESDQDIIPEGACVKVIRARTHLYTTNFSHCSAE